MLRLFVLWKTLLLLIAWASPGPGYDTSASLLFEPDRRQSGVRGGELRRSTSTPQLPGIGRLVRWDAIYFVEIIRRGYLHEQEWAFAPGFPKTVAWTASGKRSHSTVLACAKLILQLSRPPLDNAGPQIT